MAAGDFNNSKTILTTLWTIAKGVCISDMDSFEEISKEITD